MTQYIETFHRRNGVYVNADILPIPELTSRWGLNVRLPLVIDGKASTDGLDVWGLTIEDPITDGLDTRCIYLQNQSGTYNGMVSIARCPDFVDGTILVKCSAQRKTSFFATAVALRASGATGNETGYVAGVFGSSTEHFLRIYKFVAGVPTALGGTPVSVTGIAGYVTPVSVPLPEYVAYMEFQAIGNALKLRIWSVNAPRPTTWQLELTDSSIATAGWAGAGAGSGASTEVKDCAISFISVSDNANELPYIPKDRDERRRFLNSSEPGVVLFEAGVLGTTDGGTTGLSAQALVSNLGFVTKAGDYPPNTAYPARIASMGDFSQTLNGDTLTGRATQGFGDVVVRNDEGVIDHWVRWNWSGRPFRVLVGAKNWRYCDFMLAARGTIERVEKRSQNELVFKLRDGSNLLKRKLTRTAIGGTTVNAEKPEPVLIGYVFNVSPALKTEATHRYKLHRSGSELTDITAARENGASILGSLTKDLANGEFVLTASPAGDVTIDAYNSTNMVIFGGSLARNLNFPTSSDASTYNSPGSLNAIFKAIAYVYSALAEDQIYINPELNSDVLAGLYISAEEDPDADGVLDEIAMTAHGSWFWNLYGELTARYLDLTGAYGSTVYPAGYVIDLTESHMLEKSFKLKRLIPPSLFRKFFYQRNWTKQSNMAGSVTENNRALYASDGILVSAAPSVSGLDQPSNHTSARQPENKVTLFYQNANAVFQRENSNFAKLVGVFEFQTRAFFGEWEIMRNVDLIHSRYGLSAGVRGVVTGLRRDFRSRITTVELAIRLNGDWPDVTAAYPFVGPQEFLP